ncbi:putative transmembrane protein [Stenotrophomonas maltophilia K279a]|uniref:Transmembrane protein n=1 Tax=Stenotrophomonas maltophilia (strain K279a) TaxID=522373 RepID=B2FME3_STRMK|nr:putative transmembrane protein [Stenotrophomonas maltophilia K279a]
MRVDRNPTSSLGNRSFLLFVRKKPSPPAGFFRFRASKMHVLKAATATFSIHLCFLLFPSTASNPAPPRKER